MEEAAIEQLSFAIQDYIVLAVILILSLSIGVFYACTGGRQRSTEEFLLANRNMNPIPVALSIAVSFISAITFLGTTSESYTNGVMIWLHVVAVFLSALVTGLIFLPVLHRIKITSANEVYMRTKYL